MCPETVVYRHECYACTLAEQRRQHHVTGIQGVNKIRRKCIFLFHHIWSSTEID